MICHLQARIPGAASPRGKHCASPDLPRSEPVPFGFHGFDHFVGSHLSALVRERRVIQIGGLAGASPATADRNVWTCAIITQFRQNPAMTIAALQFLEQGTELETQLQQAAPAIASQVVAHGKDCLLYTSDAADE